MVKLQAGPHPPGPEWTAARAAKRPRTLMWGVPPLTRRRATMCRHLQLQDGWEAQGLDWLAGEDEGCRLSARGGGGQIMSFAALGGPALCCCCCAACPEDDGGRERLVCPEGGKRWGSVVFVRRCCLTLRFMTLLPGESLDHHQAVPPAPAAAAPERTGGGRPAPSPFLLQMQAQSTPSAASCIY